MSSRLEELWAFMMEKQTEEKMVTLRIKQSIVDLIDKERDKYSTPRSSWITQAIVEKLERLGYEIK